MIARLWTALGTLATSIERFAAAVNGVSGQVERHAGLAPAAPTPQVPDAAPPPPEPEPLPAPGENGERRTAGAGSSGRRGRR